MTAGSLALAQLMAGCGQTADRGGFQVSLLQGSTPRQLLREFQRRVATHQSLDFLPIEGLANLYQRLQTWHEQSAARNASNLVTLGDYWLTNAIQQELIQPLSLPQIEGWQTLADAQVWQTLVRRDRQGVPSETGELWAAPYRWGTLMMVYDPEPFESRGLALPTDWSDLWRPELKQKISLLDSPRSVIGLVLKQLGRSVNTEDLSAVPELADQLTALHQQVKFYSSNDYLQPLTLGDTWLAVGWSMEILPLLKSDSQLTGVVPPAGTILTADLWVQPASVTPSSASAPQPNAIQTELAELTQQWISFWWEEPIATQLSLLSLGASPIFWKRDRSQLPSTLQALDLLLPDPAILQKSEFLLPLADVTTDQYQDLWVEVRQG